MAVKKMLELKWQQAGSNLTSEQIYEYFSKHAVIHGLDEDTFDNKINKQIRSAIAKHAEEVELADNLSFSNLISS